MPPTISTPRCHLHRSLHYRCLNHSANTSRRLPLHHQPTIDTTATSPPPRHHLHTEHHTTISATTHVRDHHGCHHLHATTFTPSSQPTSPPTSSPPPFHCGLAAVPPTTTISLPIFYKFGWLKHFKTLSLDKLRSPNFDLFSDKEEHSEEEVTEAMAETIEQYMSKTRSDYGSGVARPKIEDKDNFELKGQFVKELCDNTISGSDHEDANEHIEKVIEIVDLFHIPNITIGQVMLRAFPMRWSCFIMDWMFQLDKFLIPRGAKPSMTATDAKVAIQEMAEYSQKWHNGTSRIISTNTSDGLAAIEAQLNNLGREINKVNEKVYAAQVGCEQYKSPHYIKDCPLKEEGKTLEEAYYT
ncbi:hypothetical protein Tco_1221130 [Tanacetum coccineum]